MFEVEQVDYDKEQIDWSYITFNDNKVGLRLAYVTSNLCCGFTLPKHVFSLFPLFVFSSA